MVDGGRLTFDVLGPVELRVSGRPVVVAGERQRLVLVALLLRANQRVGVAELAEAIWQDDPPATARRQVQNAVSQLRQLLLDHAPARMLTSGPAGYCLHLDPDQLDLLRFEALARRGRRLAAEGQPAEAAARLREALSLWRGPALAGLAGSGLQQHAVRLDELRLDLLEVCVEQELAAGVAVDLVPQLSALVDEHPLRERFAAALMVALYRAGRQADALALYQRVAGLLREELGVDPGPALQRTFRAVLRGAVTNSVGTGEQRVGTAPEPAPVPVPHAPRRPRWTSLVAGAIGLAVLLSVTGAASARPWPPMTGLFNVVAVPFTADQPGTTEVASRLEATLFRQVADWSAGVAGTQLRVLSRSDMNNDAGPDGLARRHHADLVLSGRLTRSPGGLTVTISVFVADRTFGETPEFVGAHEFTVVEPADVLRGNWAINAALADGTLHYVKGVVEFARGLGLFALDDFAGAADRLAAADTELTAADRVAGWRSRGRDAVHLVLGNAVGRAGSTRMAEAEQHFRRALAENPSSVRARVGLAEATRAGTGCRPTLTDPVRLVQAITGYRSVLATESGVDDRVLLEMKARLGLGLAYQCMTVAGLATRWAEAFAEFGRVADLARTHRAGPAATRHALRLVAEARAGQGLIALLTATNPDAARYGGRPAAIAYYGEALATLARIDTVRRTNLERERVFLCNLRRVHEESADPDGVGRAEKRIAAVDRRLAAMPTATPSPGEGTGRC